jgi:hypothetical protein
VRRPVFVALVISGLLTVMLPITAGPTFADGAFIARMEDDIYQPSQKALILYEDNREDLILSVKYEGNASDFAWVIPVPAYPDIDVSDPYLFRELADLTLARLPSRGFGCMIMAPAGAPVAVWELKWVLLSGRGWRYPR